MARSATASPNSSIFNSLTLSALGIVFGDIGTSPLYAMREAFHGAQGMGVSEANILSVLSLVFWSLALIISLKYLLFVMRADNRGEGGVLALMSLALPAPGPFRKAVVYLGLFGAALLFGDGIITPAISVLSAVEGLQVATPLFEPYILPITLFIITLLFVSQYNGTARIGAVFGPVIFIWFLVLGTLGIFGIAKNPQVLAALNPMHALTFLFAHGIQSLAVLGAVFLAVTGGEALYADMGHFGRRPIQRAWLFVALPGLLLNYFGQGALLLDHPEAAENPFYLLAPQWALYPLVLLSTMATVTASQAMISGVFSLTRQAVQLGYSPRFRIVHTSSKEIGQIYIPQINWALFIMVCWLVLEFRSSSALASAYGIAVSTTMTITTVLACLVAFNKWRWGWFKTGLILVFLLALDLMFLSANLAKVFDGGWFPLAVGVILFTLMTTWRRGREILMERLKEKSVPFAQFVEKMKNEPPTRVRGTAVFMTGDPHGTPPALLHNVRHNRVLHSKNILMTVLTEDIPHVKIEKRVEVDILSDGFYRITAHYGFMETPDINYVFKSCAVKGVQIDMPDVTFFLGRETLLASARPGMAIWREKLFSFMSKNAERAISYFNIPPEQVVEVGLQVEL